MQDALCSKDTLINIDQVCHMLSISKSTAFRWQKENILPESTLIGAQAKRWRLSQIEDFIQEKFNTDEASQ